MMRVRAIIGLLLALALGAAPVSAQMLVSGLTGPATPVFAQIGPGATQNGATAAGAKVSLLGSGRGTPAITCPYAGASWWIKGGGIFSTAAVVGTITPEVSFGAGAVSRGITNVVASATNARWTGEVILTCVTVGSSGTMRATGIGVNYATGTLADGSAPLNNDGAAITLDNTGSMAVGVSVTMSNQNAANIFRLDVLTIVQVN